MTNRKIAIVTGATGYVGSRLVRALLAEHWEVVCILREGSQPAAHDWHQQVNCRVYDGRFESLLGAGDFAGREIVVFHLAAMATSRCPGGAIGEMIASNITFGAHVLEAMRHWGATKLVNTGTFWQFDRNGRYQPNCLYAATKEAFEQVVAYHAVRDQVRCATLVLFDVYGPADPRKKILQLLNACARSGEKLALSPGRQKMDMVYIADVVAAFKVAAGGLLRADVRPGFAARHAVSSGTQVTLQDLVAAYEQVMSVRLNVEWGGIAYREQEVMEPWQPAPQDGLEGWRPQYDLFRGLTAMREAGV